MIIMLKMWISYGNLTVDPVNMAYARPFFDIIWGQPNIYKQI